MSATEFNKRIQDLTAEFVGRDWLLQQVTDFLFRDPNRYMMIVGEAGIGKSAVAARLTQVIKIHAYHFCSVLEGGKLEPIAFVRSISTQLAQSLPEFSSHIVKISASHISGKVEVVEMKEGIAAGVYIEKFIVQTKSAMEAFQYLVREPLRAWIAEHDPKEPIVILVDSLDEAERLDRHPNIVDLIKATHDLPPHVRWILTSRPGKHLSTLPGTRTLMLEESRENTADVKLFVSNILHEPDVSTALKALGQDAEILSNELQQRSGGNFLYLRFVLAAIRKDAAAGRFLGEIDRLPVGLDGVYKEFLERALSNKADEWAQTFRPVLGVLATAQESLSLVKLAALSGIKSQVVNDVLVNLRELLDVTTKDESGGSRIFHTSFKDFLTDVNVNPDYWIDPQDYHQQIAFYYLDTYAGDWEKCDRYGLQYLPSHLSVAGCSDKLRVLLLDFNWLQAKLSTLDVNSVLSDFTFLPDDAELGLVRSAIKLAAHDVAADTTHLAGQLLGRLRTYDSQGIQTILDKASKWRAAKWLRPLTPSLARPGGDLLNTIKAHSGLIEDLSITVDGQKMLTASADHTVKVWNLQTGLELQTLRGHTDFITGVVVGPDRRRAVSCSHDGTLKVWDIEKGDALLTLRGHEDWVTCLAVTEDGQIAVSGANDKTLRIWDLANGRLLHTLSGHEDHLQDVTVLSKQRRILSASWDRTLRCWDLDAGKELAVLDQTSDLAYTAVAVSRDERIAVWACGVGSDDPRVSVWDITDNRKLFTFAGHTSMIKSVAISPDGRRAASCSWDQTIRIWDLLGGTHLRTFHDNDWLAVIKFLDTRHIISGSYEGSIKIWDIDSESGEPASGDYTSDINTAAIDTHGHAVVGLTNGTFELWRTDGSRLRTQDGRHQVTAVTITPDGVYLVSGSYCGTLKVWEVETGALVRTVAGHAGRVLMCSLSQDGRVVVSHSDNKVFKVWDLHTVIELRTLADKDFPYRSTSHHTLDANKAFLRSVSVTPDVQRVLYSCSVRDYNDAKRMYLNIWDWETNVLQRILTTHTDYINSVAITTDGHLGISASDDYTLEVWDLEEKKKLHKLKGHTDWIKHVAVTLDGKRAISATGRGPFGSAPEANLRIWDLTQGIEIHSLYAGKNLITSIALTQDGRQIIFTSEEGSLQVWDIETGEEVASFNSDYGLNACAVSAEGSTIVAGGKTGKIHLFALEG